MAKRQKRGIIFLQLPENFHDILDEAFEESFVESMKKWNFHNPTQEEKDLIKKHSFNQLYQKIRDVSYSRWKKEEEVLAINIVEKEQSEEFTGTDFLIFDGEEPENYINEYRGNSESTENSEYTENTELNVDNENKENSEYIDDIELSEDSENIGYCVSVSEHGVVDVLEEEEYRGDDLIVFHVTQGFTLTDTENSKTVKMKNFYDYFLDSSKKWIQTAAFYGVASYR